MHGFVTNWQRNYLPKSEIRDRHFWNSRRQMSEEASADREKGIAFCGTHKNQLIYKLLQPAIAPDLSKLIEMSNTQFV